MSSAIRTCHVGSIIHKPLSRFRCVLIHTSTQIWVLLSAKFIRTNTLLTPLQSITDIVVWWKCSWHFSAFCIQTQKKYGHHDLKSKSMSPKSELVQGLAMIHFSCKFHDPRTNRTSAIDVHSPKTNMAAMTSKVGQGRPKSNRLVLDPVATYPENFMKIRP